MCVRNIHTFSKAPWKINIVTYTRACLEFRNLKLGNGVSPSETGRKRWQFSSLELLTVIPNPFFKKGFCSTDPKGSTKTSVKCVLIEAIEDVIFSFKTLTRS